MKKPEPTLFQDRVLAAPPALPDASVTERGVGSVVGYPFWGRLHTCFKDLLSSVQRFLCELREKSGKAYYYLASAETVHPVFHGVSLYN